MANLDRRLALAILVLVAAVHLVTLEISPVIWQDEVQIVDLGRSTLSPDTDWSLNWSTERRPVAFLNYIGPVLQETTYRWLAPSIVGPRLSTLIGALVAAWLMFRWLRSRFIPDTPAAVLAALFLIDPIFVQGYRGARVDAWVIAVMLAVCLLVGSSASSLVSTGRALRLAFAAGFGLVIAFGVWPSAIYLLPLVAVEVIQGFGRSQLTAATAAKRSLAGMAGVLFGVVVFALSAGGQLPSMFADTFQSQAAYYRTPLTWAVVPTKLWDFAWSYQQSPLIPIAAGAAAVAGRGQLLGAATVVAVIAMLPSNIYVHRVVYLLPYLIGLVGLGWPKATEIPGRRWPAAALALAMIWAGGVSLVARPALALAARAGRDTTLIDRAAATMPVPGSSRIYLGPWEFYYAGRSLGWKMVRPYGVVETNDFRRMFTELDYALVDEKEAASQRDFFAAMGWRLVHQVTLPSAQAAIGAESAAAERRYYLYSRWQGTP